VCSVVSLLHAVTLSHGNVTLPLGQSSTALQGHSSLWSKPDARAGAAQHRALARTAKQQHMLQRGGQAVPAAHRAHRTARCSLGARLKQVGLRGVDQHDGDVERDVHRRRGRRCVPQQASARAPDAGVSGPAPCKTCARLHRRGRAACAGSSLLAPAAGRHCRGLQRELSSTACAGTAQPRAQGKQAWPASGPSTMGARNRTISWAQRPLTCTCHLARGAI